MNITKIRKESNVNGADEFRKFLIDQLRDLKNPDGSWGTIARTFKDFINVHYQLFVNRPAYPSGQKELSVKQLPQGFGGSNPSAGTTKEKK